MDHEEITNRLKALGLGELIDHINDVELPFPNTRRRILRMLEISATTWPEKATEIMKLHKAIADEKP